MPPNGRMAAFGALVAMMIVPAPLAAPSAAPTVRAVRAAIRVDGRLDEALYSTTDAIAWFVQQEPDEGKPATEKTEAWVFFDDDMIYVAARCWESHPERRAANEMRRDAPAPAERHVHRRSHAPTAVLRNRAFVVNVNRLFRP